MMNDRGVWVGFGAVSGKINVAHEGSPSSRCGATLPGVGRREFDLEGGCCRFHENFTERSRAAVTRGDLAAFPGKRTWVAGAPPLGLIHDLCFLDFAATYSMTDPILISGILFVGLCSSSPVSRCATSCGCGCW
jgi:hypothetical protein